MKSIINRMREPSSWAGIAFIATTFFRVPANTAELAVQAGTALCGLLAVVLPEASK